MHGRRVGTKSDRPFRTYRNRARATPAEIVMAHRFLTAPSRPVSVRSEAMSLPLQVASI
jgi:hypothetical protein